jgi:hypothetical protein
LFPAGAQTLGSVASGGLGSTLSNVATEALKSSVPDILKGFTGPSSPYDVSEKDIRLSEQGFQNREDQKAQEAQALGQNVFIPRAGLAEGGAVGLENGDFILPADVVSALGNGSTKAGANFLDEFFGLEG